MKPFSNLKLPQSISSSAKSDAAPDSLWTGSVVFLFVQDYVLFIKRSESMPSHRGQIAFVGGHRQEGETPEQTARREFIEETGMSDEDLKVEGYLDIVRTSTKSKICPLVCSLPIEPARFIKKIKSNGEWSEAMLVPFENLLDRSKWTFANSVLNDSERKIQFYPLMRGSYLAHSGDNNKDHLLWGATARMVWNFFKFHNPRAK